MKKESSSMYGEESFYVALSEILGVDIDIIEMLQPKIGENTGNSKDEWHYGYYFEIPDFDELDDDVLEQILGKLLPLGEIIYLSDGELSDTQADPLGWGAEALEIDYYQKNSIPQNKVLDDLTLIEDKIRSNSDDLIKKSLIFSSFSLVESYIKTLAWGKIPSISNNILNENLRKVSGLLLNYKMSEAKGRNQVLKMFSSNGFKDLPQSIKNIRNVLAHDISATELRGDLLYGKDLKGNDVSKDIFELLNDLKIYIQNIEN